jgi:hypothetical protein
MPAAVEQDMYMWMHRQDEALQEEIAYGSIFFHKYLSICAYKHREEVIGMCGDGNVKCKIEVTELEDGYRIQVTGGDVKDVLKPENLEKCIETCCSVKEPSKGPCCG